MPSERQSPPARNQGASNVTVGDSLILHLTGCICGCVPGEACITERPAPTPKTCWCAAFGIEYLSNGVAARAHAQGHPEIQGAA